MFKKILSLFQDDTDKVLEGKTVTINVDVEEFMYFTDQYGNDVKITGPIQVGRIIKN